MSYILNDEDLERLTGHRQRSKQETFLKRHGIYYIPNEKGLFVTLQWVNDSKKIQPTDQLPDFGALKAG